MRLFDKFIVLSRELVKADANLLAYLEDLRIANVYRFIKPDDPFAITDFEQARDLFCLALAVRDDIASRLDAEESKSKKLRRLGD